MPKVTKVARRFAVKYHMMGDPSTVLRQGFAVTVGGAVRSAVYRVFVQQYGLGAYATIHDRELGVDLMHVRLSASSVSASFTSEALKLARSTQLRRVK